MAVRVIAADKEQILNTETLATSALAFKVQVYLPNINDGTGASVAVDTSIRVQSLGAASVEVLTKDGRRAWIVPPRAQGVFTSRTGTVQGEPDGWNYEIFPHTPAAFVAPSAAYVQAEAVAVAACLIKAGLMKAE